MKNTNRKLSFTNYQESVKHNLHFTILLILTVLLNGCARKADPVTAINDGIQNSVNELVDYASNNMTMDSDKQLLLQGAKDCAARADAMTKTYSATIEKCSAEKSKLKLERNGLFGIIILLLVVMFRSPLKSIGKKFLGL